MQKATPSIPEPVTPSRLGNIILELDNTVPESDVLVKNDGMYHIQPQN
jgi:hypothetical protein